MISPYDILNLPHTASQLEILQAYRTLAQIFHPDRWHDAPERVRDETARLMRQLNSAYETLSNPGSASAGSSPKYGGQAHRPSTAGWARPPSAPSAATTDASWDRAVRERARRAAEANAAKRAREAAAVNGEAVARPRGAKSPSAVHAGLGEALVTNRIPCRSCSSIQWLPDNWRERFDDVVYHCCVCDAVLLAHRPRHR